MTSRGPIVKKHFPFFPRFTLEIPFQIRDSAIPSAIAETDWHYNGCKVLDL